MPLALSLYYTELNHKCFDELTFFRSRFASFSQRRRRYASFIRLRGNEKILRSSLHLLLRSVFA